MNPDTYCIKVSEEHKRETLPPKYEFRGFFPSMDRLLINFQPQIYPDLPPDWHREDYSDLKSSSTVRFIVWNGEEKDTPQWYFSVYGSYQIGPYDVLVEQRFPSPDKAEETFNKYCEYATETYGEPIRESDEYGYSVWEDSLIFGYGADEKKLEYILTLDGSKLKFRIIVVEVKGKEIEWDEGN
jgi:hypothetical protein